MVAPAGREVERAVQGHPRGHPVAAQAVVAAKAAHHPAALVQQSQPHVGAEPHLFPPRVGHGGKLEYAGDSRIVDPMGEVLAGGARSEALLVADVDPARVAEVRATFPFLQDRRTGRPANA